MREYNYGVTGKDRKNLVAAVSEILGTESKYHAAPNYEYTVGDYTVTRDGTLLGLEDISLIAWLRQKGFELGAEAQPEADIGTRVEPKGEAVETEAQQEAETDPVTIVEPEMENAETEVSPEPEPRTTVAEVPPETDDMTITIEYPRESMSDEAISNLRKLVAAKEPILKMALGMEELPIILTPETIQFPWLRGEISGDDVKAYAQLIVCLCETAKRKKRVTAGVTDSDNFRFSCRVFMISLGMVGPEYAKIRRMMIKNLPGDSGFRYGKPKKAEASAVATDKTGEAAETTEPAETAEATE